jgi:hypothetical protein
MEQKREKLTYEILQQRRLEQNKLIAEGKIKKPKIVYGFTAKDREEFDNGYTLDEIQNELEKKYGKI